MARRRDPRRAPAWIDVPVRPAAVALARHYLRRRLHAAGLPPDRRDDIVLAASELVTGAIEDRPDRVRVSIDMDDEGGVQLVVTSRGPDARCPSQPAPWRSPVLRGTGAHACRLDVAGDRIVTCSFDAHGRGGRQHG